MSLIFLVGVFIRRGNEFTGIKPRKKGQKIRKRFTKIFAGLLGESVGSGAGSGAEAGCTALLRLPEVLQYRAILDRAVQLIAVLGEVHSREGGHRFWRIFDRGDFDGFFTQKSQNQFLMTILTVRF